MDIGTIVAVVYLSGLLALFLLYGAKNEQWNEKYGAFTVIFSLILYPLPLVFSIICLPFFMFYLIGKRLAKKPGDTND